MFENFCIYLQVRGNMDKIEVRLEEIDLNLNKIEDLSPEELSALGRFSNLVAADGVLSPRGNIN